MMLPRSSDQVLLPVNPVFIYLTLAAAFAFNLLPFGRAAGMPDVLAVALAFWSVHQPRRIGLGLPFVFGVLMDVHQGALLGQHALAYSLLAFAAIAMHRRLLWFDVAQQAVQVVPLFLAAHGVQLVVRVLAGDMVPGWWWLLAPFAEAALWAPATLLLLAPQRRAPDRDQNRPL
jgi:rod shape-determining protein MreD